MSDRAFWIKELGDASADRHGECRAALMALERLRLAVLAVQHGEPTGLERLESATGTDGYNRQRMVYDFAALIKAEDYRQECLKQLEQLDSAPECCG